MVRRKSRSELETAEIRLQTLRERRDALNAEAAAARQERDLLHSQKQDLAAKLRALRARRSSILAQVRAHREARNRWQAEARHLVELRRASRGRVRSSITSELKRLQEEARALEMRQQTATLTVAQENDLIDTLKATMRSVRELEALKADQDTVAKEISDLDAEIDERFRKADEEHSRVLGLSAEADFVHGEVAALVPQIATITAEADRKHEEFLALRAKADEVHANTLEMREKIITIRGERRAEIREAREALRNQTTAVRRALFDDRKLDEAAERAVQSLLRGGRVEIKG